MLQIQDPANCCGCTACESICPSDAILMEPDALGFLYPRVDESACIGCGKCIQVCPWQNGYETPFDFERPLAFGARHKDDNHINTSQSGGASVAISDVILERGGVVYGVGFGSDHSAVHKRATTKEERDEFKGSKYVQSELRGIFKQVRADLKGGGREVVFFGTPCQVAGLKKFISPSLQANLYLVDLICHGVPSPQLWLDFINYLERIHGGRVTKAEFRSRAIGWKCDKHSLYYLMDDNEQSEKVINDTRYMELFGKNIFLRKSCRKCIFSKTKRPGDITVGDFWGIGKVDSSFGEDNRGVSLVLANNPKGLQLFEQARASLNTIDTTIDKCLQPNLRRSSSENKLNQEFEYNYISCGADYVFERCNKEYIEKTLQKNIKKIGIVGNYWGETKYGAVLRAHALVMCINSLDITYQCEQLRVEGYSTPSLSDYTTYRKFWEKIPHNKVLCNVQSLANLGLDYDCLICGAGPVWDYKAPSNPFAFLAYTLASFPSSIKRLAYSAGYSSRPSGDASTVLQKALAEFGAISVYESSLAEHTAALSGLPVEATLDPTLLLETAYWKHLAVPRSGGSHHHYVLAYSANGCTWLGEAKAFATSLGYEFIYITDHIDDQKIEVEKFLGLILNASYVLTDSFYGVVFSIIFHRNFLVTTAAAEGDCHVDLRIEELLNLVGLSDRRFSGLDQSAAAALASPCDWDAIDELLAHERERSTAWLKRAIDMEPRRLPENQPLASESPEYKSMMQQANMLSLQARDYRKKALLQGLDDFILQGKRFEDHPVWKNLGWKKGKVFIHGAGEAGQKACQCLSAPPAGFLDMNDALDEVNGIKVYTSKLWSKIISNDDIVLITPVMDYEGIAEHVKTARRGAQCIFVGEFVDFI